MDHIPFRSVKQESKSHQIKNNVPFKQTKQSANHRKTRSDKCHDIKFPITLEEKVRLKIAFKQANIIYKQLFGFDKKITQTSFNTALLRYSLHVLRYNQNFVSWDRQYSDSPFYMHTKPKEYEYNDIGGTYGLSTRKGLSDRKTVYCLVLSALEKIEKGDGKYEDVLQFIK